MSNNDRKIADEIAALDRRFEEQFAAGDARALVDNYFVTDDLKPTASGPGQPPVRGRTALAAMYQEQMKVFSSVRLETIDVETSDSLAHVIGRAHLGFRSGEKAIGRYTVLFRKTAAGWRAQVDFFAADGWP